MSAEAPPTEAPPTAPDLDKAPNFDALVDWVKKLQFWCNEAVQRMAELKEEVAEAKREAAESESDAEDKVSAAEGDFKSLVEFVQDVERGVRKGPELFAYMRQNGWML